MNREKLLPLGSVVYLKEGIIPLMIGIRQPIVQLDKGQCYFDYAGFSQLTGINADEIAYFNNEDIREVIAEGYIGKEEDTILAALKDWREDTDIEKGLVTKDKSENSIDEQSFGF
ncbi:DUF4176 domain-containing protein [Lactococcus allomyrinae]|uniref:DUF4176 domain-containing protein n=1 Tax=Lactococcus allomyrinae TaxID=2419773 RepID=A0A387BDX9_9LACT|nr:DUF4176 domain-containing protein [Lactococcus allomyrinae]AYG00464.1 DUF4176 domain-containing protein [Lactococcus allomyrinae]